MKKYVSLILCTFLLISNAFAIDLTEKAVQFEIENGRLVESSQYHEIIQDTIDTYFSMRNINDIEELLIPAISTYDEIERENVLLNDSSLRATALRSFWLDEGINIVSTDNTTSIMDAKMSPYSSDIDIVAYEWTWVYYNNGEYPDGPATDYFGFATIHDMTIQSIDDTFKITRDSYEEADISGHISADYNQVDFNEKLSSLDTSSMFSNIVNLKNKDDYTSITATPVASTQNSSGMPDVWACIEWADTHVKHDIANTTTPNTGYYDMSFGDYGSNDCANYVSQCLYAGKFVQDRPGWYNNQDGGKGKVATRSLSWTSIGSFIPYWTERYGEIVTVTNSNVYPGNPVFNSAESHVVICVGQNSTGRAIVNGHTRDVYHQPIWSGYTKTILINKNLPYVLPPKNANEITIPKTYPSTQLYMQAGKGEWFHFTVSTAGTYTFYSTGTTNTYGALYKGADVTGSGTSQGSDLNRMCLTELANNDNYNGGINFRFTLSLTKGDYYLMVRGNSPTTKGAYGLVFQKD